MTETEQPNFSEKTLVELREMKNGNTDRIDEALKIIGKANPDMVEAVKNLDLEQCLDLAKLQETNVLLINQLLKNDLLIQKKIFEIL